MIMLRMVARRTEGRGGSQPRLDQGGRYLGYPPTAQLGRRTRARRWSSPRPARCPRNRVRYILTLGDDSVMTDIVQEIVGDFLARHAIAVGTRNAGHPLVPACRTPALRGGARRNP